MIRRLFIYIFKLTFGFYFLFVGVVQVAAQETIQTDADSLQLVNSSDSTIVSKADDQEVVQDSVIAKRFLSGIELVLDYGKVLTLWTNFESKFEGGVNLRFFERIVLAGEFGYAELNPLKAYDNAVFYTVKGMYGRIGLDYYTAYDPNSFYYAGFRYGTNMFDDEGKFLIDSEYWEDYEEGFGSTDITASWFEIILGSETYLKLSKKKDGDASSKLLIGGKFRFRVLGDFTNREEPRIYSIPGYGRTFDKTIPALNLYIKYRFGT